MYFVIVLLHKRHLNLMPFGYYILKFNGITWAMDNQQMVDTDIHTQTLLGKGGLGW